MSRAYKKVLHAQPSIRSISPALRRRRLKLFAPESPCCPLCAVNLRIVEGTRNWVGCEHFPEHDTIFDNLDYRSELS